MTTPAWSAPRNGIPGNLEASNASAQINQLLGTHGITPVYAGNVVLNGTGGTHFTWTAAGNSTDLSQPFVMPGGQTAVGRVNVAVQPTGAGADLLVSLCPDNGSGAPNTSAPIVSTMVPAQVIDQLASPTGLPAGGPLAAPWSDALYLTGSITDTVLPGPAGSAGGAVDFLAPVTAGNYLVIAGGYVSGAAIASVFAAPYLGAGQLGPFVPQPPLPQATTGGMLAATPSALVYVGGGSAPSPPSYFTNVWAANWDPATGTVGSWSAQAAYPLGIIDAASATYNNTVYVIGGVTTGAVLTNSVYYATVTNGQLSAWTAAPSLPVPTDLMCVAVIGNWLIATGGALNFANTSVSSTTYYAAINPADGSLGPWQTGPPLPTAVSAGDAGWNVGVTDSAIVVMQGYTGSGTFTFATQSLTVGAEGLSDQWRTNSWNISSGGVYFGFFPVGDGSWDVINPLTGSSLIQSSNLINVPQISVPLPATGLTPGSTYHVVMQPHQTSSASDYLSFGTTTSTGLPSQLQSARHANSWSATASGFAMPISVLDLTATGPLRHLAEDPNASGVNQKWSTFEFNNQGLLTGHLESTLSPNVPLNSNPTFASGVSPWTPTGGTFVQSAAQTHGGFAFSGLLTPNGIAAQAFAASELLPVQQGGGPFYGASSWYLADGWFYSTPGTTAFSFSVAWYDRLGTLLSTSASTITLTAATWTHVQNWFEAPAGAAQARLMPTESGTPAASKLLYVSNAFLIQSWECVSSFSSAATVNYGASPWPPTGVTQLL